MFIVCLFVLFIFMPTRFDFKISIEKHSIKIILSVRNKIIITNKSLYQLDAVTREKKKRFFMKKNKQNNPEW